MVSGYELDFRNVVIPHAVQESKGIVVIGRDIPRQQKHVDFLIIEQLRQEMVIRLTRRQPFRVRVDMQVRQYPNFHVLNPLLYFAFGVKKSEVAYQIN